jgi:hypothetical protein
MGDAKNTDGYQQGGGDDGYDGPGDNPTGRNRKASSGQRRKKLRKLFGGTDYEIPESELPPGKKGKRGKKK